MASDGIRLPSDSTVASQRVTRKTGTPEASLSTETNRAAPKPDPLATVVLQSKPLIKGDREALYELLLQNNPKSDAPIRQLADTHIKVGTSLLLELDNHGQYQPVEKPTPEQLRQLIKLEIDFWQTQTLPKMLAARSQALPTEQALAALAKNFPELQPLVQWATQRLMQADSPNIARVLQEFSALSHWRNWQAQSTTPGINIPLKVSASTNTTQTSSVSTNKSVPGGNQFATGLSPAPVAPPASNTASPANVSAGSTPVVTNAAITQPATPIPNTLLLLFSDSRMPTQVGLQTQPANTPQPDAKVQINLTMNLSTNPVATHAKDPPPSTLAQNALRGASVEQQVAPATYAFASRSTSFTPLSNSPLINLHAILNRTNQVQPPIVGSKADASPAANAAASMTSTQAQSTLNQANAAPKLTASVTTNSGTPTESAGLLARNNEATASTTTNSATPNAAIQTAGSSQAGSVNTVPPLFRFLSMPATNHQGLPLEIKSAAWLSTLQQVIDQSPAALKTQLKTLASELLTQQPAQSFNTSVANTTSSAGAQEGDANTLLALRNWLESLQTRLQSQAIQTLQHQWVAPDQPTLQQSQIPLHWMGLSGWVDMEWWQERDENHKDANEQTDKVPQLWRMKLYFTLEPLAPVCADILWSNIATELTFWCEDAATLNHLNQLLPTLTSWTEGLGEQNIQTKHGMPPKKAAANHPTENDHLVDIRT